MKGSQDRNLKTENEEETMAEQTYQLVPLQAQPAFLYTLGLPT